MRKLICCDICNSIADINAELEKIFGKRKEGVYCFDGATPEWFQEHLDIFEKASPIPGSAAALRMASRIFKIVYVTKRPVESHDITVRWLESNGFPEGEILYARDKGRAVKALNPAFAIEDSPEDILSYMREDIPVLAVSTDYNSSLNCCRVSWRAG